MKPKTLSRIVYCLFISLSLAWTAGCEKRDETPAPADTGPVIIPETDSLKPAPAVPPSADMPPAADTRVEMQDFASLQPPPTTTTPEANMNTSPEKPDNRLTIPSFAQQTPADSDLHLRFLATGESFYTEIKLENGILSYTYFEDTQGRCDTWVQSSPCWQESDLKTISMALRNEDLDNLYTLVKESGILKLPQEKYGGAKQGQRYYAQKMEVGIEGKNKTVIYQSFPGSGKKPEAFARLETALVEYARDLPH